MLPPWGGRRRSRLGPSHGRGSFVGTSRRMASGNRLPRGLLLGNLVPNERGITLLVPAARQFQPPTPYVTRPGPGAALSEGPAYR